MVCYNVSGDLVLEVKNNNSKMMQKYFQDIRQLIFNLRDFRSFEQLDLYITLVLDDTKFEIVNVSTDVLCTHKNLHKYFKHLNVLDELIDSKELILTIEYSGSAVGSLFVLAEIDFKIPKGLEENITILCIDNYGEGTYTYRLGAAATENNLRYDEFQEDMIWHNESFTYEVIRIDDSSKSYYSAIQSEVNQMYNIIDNNRTLGIENIVRIRYVRGKSLLDLAINEGKVQWSAKNIVILFYYLMRIIKIVPNSRFNEEITFTWGYNELSVDFFNHQPQIKLNGNILNVIEKNGDIIVVEEPEKKV